MWGKRPARWIVTGIGTPAEAQATASNATGHREDELSSLEKEGGVIFQDIPAAVE